MAMTSRQAAKERCLSMGRALREDYHGGLTPEIITQQLLLRQRKIHPLPVSHGFKPGRAPIEASARKARVSFWKSRRHRLNEEAGKKE